MGLLLNLYISIHIITNIAYQRSIFNMSKTIEESQDYRGYKVCSTQYTLKKDNMRDIYLSLVHARDNLNRPIALRYTVGLIEDHSFDINKLTRKIRALFKDTGYSFIYSFEHAETKGLHLEMMLVIDQDKHNPISIFNLLRKVFFNMDGVEITESEEYKTVSLNFHERKEQYIKDTGGSKVGHNLKDEAQFIDCVYRASYLSKQDDKDKVQYKKKFRAIIG